MLPLKTICAAVSFIPAQWDDVFLDENQIIRPKKTANLPLKDMLANPVGNDPRFWREVRQLYFVFEQGKIPVDFYRQYGGILNSYEAEQLEKVKKMLNWFRVLTLMVEWVKTGRLAPLWEMFGPPRESKELETIYFVGNELEPYIRFMPWFDSRRSKLVWYTPKNDDQLIQATWEAVTEAIAIYLRTAPLTPIKRDNNSTKMPLILWGFLARGALQAAFLQWFFQEVAHMNVSTCEARGCHNIVFPPREKFCSERCRQREKKYRQRHNGKVKKSRMGGLTNGRLG